LGLLFGFQRPSRLLVAAATSCYRPASLHPIQPRGPHSLFRIGFSVKRPLSLQLHRFGSTCFVEGRGTYFASAFPVNPLCRPFSSTLRLCRLRDFRFRGGGDFYHRRVGCQLRSLTSYFVFHFFSAGASVASATSPFLPRGRGFYHHRVGSQPRSADPVFRCSTEPSYPPLHPFHSGAAAPLRQPVGRREAIPNALLPGRQILNCDDLIPRAAPRRFL